MTRFYSYIFLLLFLTLQPLYGAEAGVAERNNFLTQILSLAEKPKSYFIINLGENEILLMAKGIVIREWAVDELRFMGEPLPVKPLLLEKKSVNLDDLRSKVDIEGNKVGNSTNSNNKTVSQTDGKKTDEVKAGDNKTSRKYEVTAMEIDDMPADYRMRLNEGVTVSIKSRPDGPGIFYSLKRYTYYPVLALWSSLNKTAYTKIEIFFTDRTEAQALFWAFTDGIECIILPPGSVDREDFQL